MTVKSLARNVVISSTVEPQQVMPGVQSSWERPGAALPARDRALPGAGAEGFLFQETASFKTSLWRCEVGSYRGKGQQSRSSGLSAVRGASTRSDGQVVLFRSPLLRTGERCELPPLLSSMAAERAMRVGCFHPAVCNRDNRLASHWE